MWAKGQRLEFLEGNIPRYRDASQQGCSRASDFADGVVNTYFQLFPWYLPLDTDPLPIQSPVTHESVLPPPPLTPEEERYKRAVIKQMTKVRSRLIRQYNITHTLALSSPYPPG